MEPSSHPAEISLEERVRTLEDAHFFLEAMTFFAQKMQWQDEQTISQWGTNLLIALVPFVKGVQATMYRTDVTGHYLLYTAGYAVYRSPAEDGPVRIGETMLGQVARSQQPFFLRDPQRQVSLRSMEAVRPHLVLFLPLCYQKRTCGVLELVFMEEPQPRTLQLLDRLTEQIASHLNALIKEEALRHTLEQLQSSESRLKRIAAATREGIAFVAGKRITEVNKAFVSLLGYDQQDEVLFQRIDRFVTDTALPDRLQEKESAETEIIRKDGSQLHVEIRFQYVQYAGEKYKVFSLLDIHQRKKAELELQQSEQRLAEAQKIVELSRIIERKNEAITASIQYARRIQRAILPKSLTMSKLLGEHFVFYQPRDIVSGDFYWLQYYQKKIFLAVADCTGHGVPGAFMSMIGNALLSGVVLEKGITDPAEILAQMNRDLDYLLRQGDTSSKDGMDVAICVIDRKTRQLEYAGAHHTLLYLQEGQMYEIKGDKLGISVNQHEATFHRHLVSLEQVTTMYLYSDGITDQFGGPKKRKFGSAQLRKVLTEIHHKPMTEQYHLMEQMIKNWIREGDEPQTDDMVLLGVRWAL